MTAPSRMVIWGTNDRTTKGVSVGVGNGSDEAGRVGARVVVRHALRPLRSRCDRSPRGGRGSRGVLVGRGWTGERCDPLARSGRGSGAGCGRGGPELGGAAAGERALLAGAAGSDERRECLLDAVGGEVALAEVADLGAGESVG